MIYEEDFTNFSWFTLYNHNKDPYPYPPNPPYTNNFNYSYPPPPPPPHSSSPYSSHIDYSSYPPPPSTSSHGSFDYPMPQPPHTYLYPSDSYDLPHSSSAYPTLDDRMNNVSLTHSPWPSSQVHLPWHIPLQFYILIGEMSFIVILATPPQVWTRRILLEFQIILMTQCIVRVCRLCRLSSKGLWELCSSMGI